MRRAVKDVQTSPNEEEYVLSTEPRANDAAVKDVQIELSKEASALGMEQSRRSNYAAAKDALINHGEEECARSTVGKISNYAATKDVQTNLGEGECA